MRFKILPIEKPKGSKSNNEKNQYPAYALKSDDGKKPKKNTNILAYAVTSDDG